MILSGWKAGRLGWVLAGLLCALVLRAMPLRAQVLSFELGGQAVSLEKAPASAGAYLRALRLNRATGRWDVDVVVTNGSERVLRGPLVLRFDVARGVAPGIAGTTVDGAGQPFLELTSRLAGGELAPGSALPVFTLSLGDGQARPTLAPALYSRPAAVGPGLVLLRTLGADGVPLEGVEIEELGVSPSRRFRSGRGGWTSLEALAGVTGWRMTAAGRVPVVRLVPAGLGDGVAEVESARLVPVDGSGVTVLGLQALPAPLPRGWSPLAAVVRGAGVAGGAVELAEPVGVGGTAVLVRWEDAALAWRCVRLIAGDGGRTIPVSGEGVFAVVRADVAPVSPPAAVAGELLVGVPVALGGAGLTATGRVDPSSRAASVNAALVTAEATVEFVSGAGRLTSGLVVPVEVTEEYRLRDGSRRILPSYGLTLTAYQRPGGAEASALVARFPLRPMQLLAGEELEEAVVRVAVLAPGAFGGVRMNAAGGVIEVGGLRLEAEAGVLGRGEAVVLRRLAPGGFVGALPAGLEAVEGFEVGVGLTEAGRSFRVRRAGLSAGAGFVLARAIHDSGRHGFLPVERLRTDGAGVLGTVEPSGGDRLPGVDGGGQYWLFRVGAAQSLVTGIVRGAGGQAVAGATVRLGPWTAFAEASGRYRLLASEGAALLGVLDPATGDSGGASVVVGAGGGVVTADLGTSAQGPRVVGTSPADGAREVARVSPVSLEFSRALDPATVTGDSVRLRASDGAVIPASVSVGGTRRTVTLLPSVLMPPDAALRVELAPTIADATGRVLEGARQFGFRTQGDSLIRADATLVIHEPAAGVAPMVGGPGLAEPESPVILVNETTGRTSTVLSRPDGSFSNNIPADVEDFLSAVIVNRNGSRNVVPASRQLFRDGRVGLYAGGGVVTASIDGSSVEVTAPAGSIAGKTVFRLRPVLNREMDEALALQRPEGAKGLRAFQLELAGDPLAGPLKVRQPVAAGEIGVLAGARPEDMAFALIRGVQRDGATLYEVIDIARYVDGHVETAGELDGVRAGMDFADGGSAPVGGGRMGAAPATAIALLPFHTYFFTAMIDSLRAHYSVVNGRVEAVDLVDGERVAGSESPVVGAAVRVGSEQSAGTIQPGSLVAISTSNGSYSLPGNVALVARNTIVGTATSQFFPGQVAVTRATYVPGLQRVPMNLRFRRGGGSVIADDRERPTLSVAHAPASPQTNLTATLRVLANDDRQMSRVDVVPVAVTGSDPAVPVTLADVVVTQDPGEVRSGQTIRRTYGVRSVKPLRVDFLVVAEDAAGRTNAVPYAMTFGGPPAPPVVDPNDVTGPFVTGSTPSQGAEGILPGQTIRLRFSEPLRRELLSNPGAAFQLLPAAGVPVAALHEGDTVVELTWYRLEPGTEYRLTVLPVLHDLNGNAFDQNPYNNPVGTTAPVTDAFTLRFTTAALSRSAMPGVINGVGAAALGRRLLVLDKVSASQGAIHVFDAENPAQPRSLFSIRVPAFPRAMTVIPQWSYRRSPGGAPETHDLVVAAGGLVGGDGQWIRVFALPAGGGAQALVTTTLSSSPAAVVGPLRWSPPILGYMENDADTTAVGLLNLQLAIIADNQTPAERAANPAGGRVGRDVAGDGDFADAGDEVPLPDGSLPRLGVVNGGLIGMHVSPDPQFRMRDFDLRSGGNFLGAILSAPPSDGRSRYTTFLSGGQPVTAPRATLELSPEAKRLLVLFGQELDTTGGTIMANLALVSQHAGGNTPARLLVLDVTDVAAPVVVNEIRIPVEHGIPQSVVVRGDGLLALATTSDQLLLDPRKLRLIPGNFSQVHPAIIGRVAGVGGGGFSFVSLGDGLFARAQGGVHSLVGAPSRVDLQLHRPGPADRPGPVVSAGREDVATNNVFLANNDWDDEDSNADREFRNSDFAKGARRVLDDDFVSVTLGRLPLSLAAQEGIRVRLSLTMPGSSVEKLARARFVTRLGLPEPAMTTQGQSLVLETTLPAPFHPLGGVLSGLVTVPLECYETAPEVRLNYEVFRADGSLAAFDSVSFVSASLAIEEVWSDQHEGSQSNGITRRTSQSSRADPLVFFNNGTGTYGEDESARYPFILMGNRVDDRTYVKLRFRTDPDLPEVRGAMKFALFRPLGRELVGRSSVTGNVASVVAEDARGAFGSGPRIFASDRLHYLDHFVVGGIDKNLDSELTTDELGAIFGRAKLMPTGVRFTRIEEFPNVGEEHLKVVNRRTYEHQAVLRGLVLLPAGVSALVQLVSGAVGDDEVFLLSAVHLDAFLAGHDPAVFGIERVGTREVPDNRTDRGGEGLQNHNVGVFGADGRHHTPLFRYGTATSLPGRVLRSKAFQMAVRRNLDVPAVAEAGRARLEAAGGARTSLDIVLTRANSRQLFGSFIPGGNGNDECARFAQLPTLLMGFYEQLVTGEPLDAARAADQYLEALRAAFSGCGPDEIDLALGIGGFSLDGMTIHAEIEPVSQPYVAGTTPFRVRNVQVQSLLRDIYDWDMGAIPLAALRSAGHGTLGVGGRIFSYEIPIDGVVPSLEVELR